MVSYDLAKEQGFAVIHNSGSWRIAVHAFEPAVNGLEAFKDWGVHQDSEEGFVLLKGTAWLVIAKGAKGDNFRVQSLQPQQIYLVHPNERHAIILKEDSAVLIMENRDMSRSYSEPVSAGALAAVKRMIGGCYGRTV